MIDMEQYVYVLVVYNYKGISEERFIVPLSEVREHDNEAYKELWKNPTKWVDGKGHAANKSWQLKVAESKEEINIFTNDCLYNDGLDAETDDFHSKYSPQNFYSR